MSKQFLLEPAIFAADPGIVRTLEAALARDVLEQRLMIINGPYIEIQHRMFDDNLDVTVWAIAGPIQ